MSNEILNNLTKASANQYQAEVINFVKDLAFSQTTRKIGNQEKEAINRVFDVIRYINSKDRYSKYMFEEIISIDEIMIPDYLKILIIPEAVVYDVARINICNDIVARPSSDLKPKYSDFVRDIGIMNGVFKLGVADRLIRLTEVRKIVTISNVSMELAFYRNGTFYVHDNSTKFIPIPVNVDVMSNYFTYPNYWDTTASFKFIEIARDLDFRKRS